MTQISLPLLISPDRLSRRQKHNLSSIHTLCHLRQLGMSRLRLQKSRSTPREQWVTNKNLVKAQVQKATYNVSTNEKQWTPGSTSLPTGRDRDCLPMATLEMETKKIVSPDFLLKISSPKSIDGDTGTGRHSTLNWRDLIFHQSLSEILAKSH